MSLILRFLALFILLAPIVHAELLIEPSAGFVGGQLVDNDDIEDDRGLKGTSVGGRLGFQKFGFQLALDYFQSYLDVTEEDKNMQLSEWSGVVGFEFPFFVRLYGGYLFGAEAKLDEAIYRKAAGFKGGIALTFIPFVHLIFEYRRANFEEQKIGNIKSEIDYDYHLLFGGISIPITI